MILAVVLDFARIRGRHGKINVAEERLYDKMKKYMSKQDIVMIIVGVIYFGMAVVVMFKTLEGLL